MIPKLNPTQFEWTIWRSGTPLDIFGVPLRTDYLMSIKPKALQYAIGYCDAENLVCRPKVDCKAVMFYKDGQLCWFHLFNSEFDAIFNLTCAGA